MRRRFQLLAVCIVLTAFRSISAESATHRVSDDSSKNSTLISNAIAGDALAQVILGFMYEKGRGVPKDEGAAVKWYRKAADQGDASAQSSLGFMYSEGRGVPKDEGAAVKWYRKAADQGDANAQFNLGLMYAHGQGVIKDPVEAHAWFNVSGASGDENARKRLAIIERTMTPEQKAEATQKARELFEKIRKTKAAKDAE